MARLRHRHAGQSRHGRADQHAGAIALCKAVRPVATSLRGLISVGTSLIGNVGPGRMIEALALADDLGDIAPHYFSFGGVVETAATHAKPPLGRNRPAVLWHIEISPRPFSDRRDFAEENKQ